jgi:hypothetical protein
VHPPQDDADTHDDFKPKFQPEPRAGGNIEDTIRADISQHKVFVYMKARPQLPRTFLLVRKACCVRTAWRSMALLRLVWPS